MKAIFVLPMISIAVQGTRWFRSS